MGSRTVFFCLTIVFFISAVYGGPRVRRQATAGPTTTANPTNPIDSAAKCIQDALKNLTKSPNLTAAQNQSVNNLLDQLNSQAQNMNNILADLIQKNPILGSLQCTLDPKVLQSILQQLAGTVSAIFIQPVVGILNGILGGMSAVVGVGTQVFTGVVGGFGSALQGLFGALAGLFSGFGSIGNNFG